MEGLFRKSGNCNRQKMLKEKISKCEDMEKQLIVGMFNAHDCASVLKVFLAELPEPVLMDRHFNLHCLLRGLFKKLVISMIIMQINLHFHFSLSHSFQKYESDY
jgi:hypothetical protein